jgi:hypothetical protein
MSSYVLGFQDIDKTTIMVVGGKGANLGEISTVEGTRVQQPVADRFDAGLGKTYPLPLKVRNDVAAKLPGGCGMLRNRANLSDSPNWLRP